MKYEKKDPFDDLIEAAISEMGDSEAAEFEATDDSGVELSDRLDQKIHFLMTDKPKARTAASNHRAKILSTAALVALVTVCVMWLAMMNAFGNLPNITDPPPSGTTGGTATSASPMGHSDSSNSTGSEESNRTESSTSDSTSDSTSRTESTTTKTENPHHPQKGSFVVPSDEKTVTCHFLASNTDGLTLEISVYGYRSTMIGKAFYLKSNEYFTVDVKIKNESSKSIYQFLPTYCREGDFPHNHEIGFDLSHKGYALHSSSCGFACAEMTEVWELKPGETCEWTLKLAAGEENAHDFDLPADGDFTGIKLYDESIYTDGSCTFSGAFFFEYRKTKEAEPNDHTVSVPLDLEIVFVSEEPTD